MLVQFSLVYLLLHTPTEWFIGDWKKMPEPWLLWINTIILCFLAVVFLLHAQIASKNNQFKNVKNRLLLIGFLALAFIIGQLLVWQQLIC